MENNFNIKFDKPLKTYTNREMYKILSNLHVPKEYWDYSLSGEHAWVGPQKQELFMKNCPIKVNDDLYIIGMSNTEYGGTWWDLIFILREHNDKSFYRCHFNSSKYNKYQDNKKFMWNNCSLLLSEDMEHILKMINIINTSISKEEIK